MREMSERCERWRMRDGEMASLSVGAVLERDGDMAINMAINMASIRKVNMASQGQHSCV